MFRNPTSDQLIDIKAILDGAFDQDGYDKAKSLLADCEGLKAQSEDLSETLRRLGVLEERRMVIAKSDNA